MPMAITLVVLLCASDGATERALGSAARATLPQHVSIDVRAVDRVPSDDDALALGRSLQAEVVVTVAWLDAEHRHASLRLHLEATGRWLERELEFGPADAPAEKGRTLGFAIASMLPEADARAPNAGAAPDDTPRPTATTADPQLVAAAPQEATAAEPPPASAPPLSAAPPVAAQRIRNGSIDAALSVSAALGGEGSGLGGALGAELDVSRHFGLRAEVALRSGHMEQLGATSLAVDLGPGVAWRSGDGQVGHPFALALRLGGFARYQDVIRPAAVGREPESHARWLPGIGLTASGLWWFSPDVALVASAGARGLLGKTDLLVQQKPVATLTPLALVLEIGLCAGF